MEIYIAIAVAIGVIWVAVNYVRNRDRSFTDRLVRPKNNDELGRSILWLKDELKKLGYAKVATGSVMIIRMVFAGYVLRQELQDEEEIKRSLSNIIKDLYRTCTLTEGVQSESMQDLCYYLEAVHVAGPAGERNRSGFVRGYFLTHADQEKSPVVLLDYLVKAMTAMYSNKDEEVFKKIAAAGTPEE